MGTGWTVSALRANLTENAGRAIPNRGLTDSRNTTLEFL